MLQADDERRNSAQYKDQVGSIFVSSEAKGLINARAALPSTLSFIWIIHLFFFFCIQSSDALSAGRQAEQPNASAETSA